MAGHRRTKAQQAGGQPEPTQQDKKLANRRASLAKDWATARSGTARLVLAARWVHAAAVRAQDPELAKRIDREADRKAAELVALGDSALPPQTATQRSRRHAA